MVYNFCMLDGDFLAQGDGLYLKENLEKDETFFLESEISLKLCRTEVCVFCSTIYSYNVYYLEKI